jgi:thiol-disulfide isomerase/thioredoxin
MASLTFCSRGQDRQGYEINVRIPELQDSTIFLGYHFGDKQYLKDTLKLDNTGSGIFSGTETLPQGIYLIVLPGKQYFEVLMSNDQYFSISCSFPEYYNTLKFTGSDENTAFVGYQKHWMELQKKATGISKRLQNSRQNPDSLKILTDLQKRQEGAMKSYLKDMISEHKGTFLSALIKAMLPIEAPVINIPSGTRNPDSLRWVLNYIYNKDHFFDNIDINDERFLRTPILQARLNVFFTNVVLQAPDSINKEIDRMINKVKDNYKVYQFISVYLFNHFRESEIMGHDAVVVKLADDIYLSGKADWVTQEFKDDLRKQVDRMRPNLIGIKAQNLVMDSYFGRFVALYDIEKEFTILYFWEPDCGHCAEATPKLKAYYDKVKDSGVEVFSVCTTADKAKWQKYIEDNKLDWINGWDPARRTNYGFYYNVEATPTIYILDRDKKIIAKKLSVDDIPSFIENYRKYFSK